MFLYKHLTPQTKLNCLGEDQQIQVVTCSCPQLDHFAAFALDAQAEWLARL